MGPMGSISDFVAAFRRDRSQYEKVEKDVKVFCKNALKGIDFLWQSRVKTPTSLEVKLKARNDKYENESANVADACDLVAGRIILARWLDIEKVEKIVKATFNIINRSQHPKPGRDIGNLRARFRGYDGLHFYVTRQVPPSVPLYNLVIEIQVMSAFMWAFSILDHDITYKNLSGEPDEGLLRSLDLLKGIANVGETGLQIFDAQFLPVAKLSSQQHSVSPELQATIRSVSVEVGFDENDTQCLRDLLLTDPRDDKSRIEASKDRLLEGSCSWVFEDGAYIDWWNREDSRLLWIHGDPGKGKTMMMMALISEVERELESLPGSNVLAYFFCQNTNSNLNTTVSVLRGLIYLLVDQEKTLVRHLRKRYDTAGRRLFEGPNSQYALLDVLLNILKDPSLRSVCLMIDALDECDNKIHGLLEWIIERNPEISPKIKWLITSRNEPAFTEPLGHGKQLHTSLELNSSHVTRAVAIFIDYKVKDLAALKLYNSKLQAFVRESLLEKAEGTFLWVALVCKELRKTRRGKEKSFLQATPAGLVPLYERMLNQVLHQGDENDKESCRRILCSVTLAFRPLRLREIAVFAEISESGLEVLVDYCGSFVTIREEIAYLIHQSAKDYLIDGKRSDIFISGQGNEHANMVGLCLDIMSGTLMKDVCNLKVPGTRLSDIDESRIGACIPFHAQYACLYWVDHLQRASHTEQEIFIMRKDCRAIDFFQRHFLHWLETLSLIRKMSEAVVAMTSLCSIPTSHMSTDLFSFVQDARRFILEFRSVIETAPLQLYYSTLVFSPETSIVKRLFSDPMLKWIEARPKVEKNWTSSLQTLEGHSDKINALILSPNGKLLASPSNDGTVKLWNPITGDSLCTLECHSGWVKSVAFSPDGQLIATASIKSIELWNPITGHSRGTIDDDPSTMDNVLFSPDSRLLVSESQYKGGSTIKLWDPITGDLQGIFGGHKSHITAIVFSPVGQLLASASRDTTIRLWHPTTKTSQGLLQSHSAKINTVVFSPNGRLLASASDDHTVKIWDPITKDLLVTLGHSGRVNTVAFSRDGYLLASGSDDHTIKLWDTTTKDLLGTFEGHSSRVNMVAFSPNGHLLTSVSDDKTIRLWDLVTNDSRGTLEGHSDGVEIIVFSLDGLVLASASNDNTIRLWDPIIEDSRIAFENHLDRVNAVVFSPDGQSLATASDDNTVKVWDPDTGDLRKTLEGHSNPVNAVVFSFDSQLLASASGNHFLKDSIAPDDHSIRLWDPTTGELRGKLEGHSDCINTVAFSPDGQLLASGSGGSVFGDFSVRLWDSFTGESRGILEGHSEQVNVVVFSSDGQLLASASGVKSTDSSDNTVRLWDPTTGDSRGTLEGHSKRIVNVVFSPDGQILASASDDDTVRLWDLGKRTLLQQVQHQYNGIIYFNDGGSRLVLDGRVFEISLASSTAFLQERTSTMGSYGLSNKNQWVCWKGHKILWLPFNRGPSAYALRGNKLIMGNKGGRMTFITFSTTVPPILDFDAK